MTKEDSDKCTQSISLRLTKDLYDRVHSRAAPALTDSAWIKMALEYALDHMDEKRPNEIAIDSLVRCLTYDEGIADIIYQKVAEKLRLTDLVRELGYFATHLKAETVTELCKDLRDTTARMLYLIRDPVDLEEMIDFKVVSGNLQWADTEWTLADFYALSDEERSRYQFFYMEACDPADRRRSTGIHFWNRKEDVSQSFPLDYFDAGETVMVHAAVFKQDHDSRAGKRLKAAQGIEDRIVKMVRYISRDENIGDTGDMTDPSLTAYVIRNRGYYPRSIPCEFTFGWVSDKWNVGAYASYEDFEDAVRRHKDDSLRPVFDAAWHYTNTELRYFNDRDGRPMFDSYAKPEYIVGKGRYDGGDGRFIRTEWREIEDPTRFDASERSKYRKFVPGEEDEENPDKKTDE